MLTRNKNILIFYFLCLLNIAGLVYFILNKKDYFFIYCLVPAAILIVFLAIFRLDTLVKGTIFFTPLSVSLQELGLIGGEKLDLSIPTEPVLAGIMLLFILNEIHSGFINPKIWRHPVTLVILVQLLWAAITTITSEMPVISLKFLVAKLWFITTAYFLLTHLFRNRKTMFQSIWLYVIPFSIVIVYTIINHAANGLTEDAADWVVKPFYNDHTSYGAMLAMYIPFLVGFIFLKNISGYIRIFTVSILALFLLALVLSYTRAAWISIAAAMVVAITLLLRIRFAVLLSFVLGLTGIIMLFQTEIAIMLSSNRTDSTGDFTENVQSISNISTDASNVERINRWNSALRMFSERPVFGFGPGTYSFQYAPYQKSSERTIISTNAGTAGNAHSEYLGPLSEQGLPGLLLMAALVIAIYFTGYRIVYTVKERNLKIITVCAVLGLSTYILHGFLNNFLDTDKAAIPFWGMIAILVSLDCFYKPEKESGIVNKKTVSTT